MTLEVGKKSRHIYEGMLRAYREERSKAAAARKALNIYRENETFLREISSILGDIETLKNAFLQSLKEIQVQRSKEEKLASRTTPEANTNFPGRSSTLPLFTVLGIM